MKIAIACDHGGYELKNMLIDFIKEKGHEVTDFGCDSKDSCSYALFGKKAAMAVSSGECDKGVLICGSGIGISISANKVKGIRCALCSEPVSATLSRLHNDANIVAMGARLIGEEMARQIVSAFLSTDFEGGRHCERVAQMMEIEN